MPASSDSKLTAMVSGAGFSFGPVILAESRRQRVQLALALALVEQESTFRNIFGCDGKRKIGKAPWCHQQVTRERVQELIAHVDAGGVSNGVGLTQLTSIGLIRQAEAAGGAHLVRAQCQVGFGLLHDLIERHGERTGIGGYNGGEGNPNLDYADSVLGLRAHWQSRINAALGMRGAAAPGDAEVHRDLMLTTPFTEGPDIRALQRAINARARELPYTDAKLTLDGQLGPYTVAASGRVAFALGLVEDACKVIRAGTIPQLSQQLIRTPAQLSPDDKMRAQEREPDLKRRYVARHTGARAAVRWARSQIGKHEHPFESNWGRPVQDWITYTGFDFPVEWCGCFVAVAVVKKGGALVPERKRLALDTAINADAANGHNGFERAVSPSDAQKGDVVTFDFHHIGLVAGPTKNGMVHSIDGNTTAADGTNPHGGQVTEHFRPVSDVAIVGRLRY
jgi:hypothetical protein